MTKYHFIRSSKLIAYQRILKEELNASTKANCLSKIINYNNKLQHTQEKLKYFQAKLTKGIKSKNNLKVHVIRGNNIPSRHFLCLKSLTHVQVSIDKIAKGTATPYQHMTTQLCNGPTPNWDRVFAFQASEAQSLSIACIYKGMCCGSVQIGDIQTYMLSALKSGNVRKMEIPLHSNNTATQGSIYVKIQYLESKELKVKEIIAALTEEAQILKDIIEKYKQFESALEDVAERQPSFDSGYFQPLLSKM